MAFTQTLPTQRSAFLDLIAWSEGTCQEKHPLTKLDGYDVIVNGVDGPEIFTDFSAHPFSRGRKAKQVSGKLYSSASGRYQHMLVHWEHYRKQLALPDFGPASQDKWAIQLIRERGALPLIDAGDVALAIFKTANLWASFPGNNYGQNPHKLEPLVAAFVRLGGKLK
jgi:muramidase (phage lysozyme)